MCLRGVIRLRGEIRLRLMCLRNVSSLGNSSSGGIRLREVIRLRGEIRLRLMCLRNVSPRGNSSSGGNSSSFNVSSKCVFASSFTYPPWQKCVFEMCLRLRAEKCVHQCAHNVYIYAYYIQIFCWNSQIPSDGIYTIYTNPVVYTYSRRWQKKVRRVQLKLFAGLRIHVLSCLKSSGSYLWTSFLTIKRINASHPWEWFKVRDFRKTNCHVNWWDLSCQPKQSVNFTLLLLALKRCCWWKNSCSPPGMYKTL